MLCTSGFVDDVIFLHDWSMTRRMYPCNSICKPKVTTEP